jgi:S1-C subfamily serine protease
MKPYIGITGSDASGDYQIGGMNGDFWSNGMTGDFQSNGVSGVVINKVEERSPADEGGLKEDDIIIKVNDKSISGMTELRSLIQNTAEVDTIKFTVNRDGEIVDVEVIPVMHKQDAKP